MNVVLAITSRNLRLYFRDPLNVFFSLLSALIVFLLYVLFLGNLQTSSISESVPGASASAVQGFVDAWMFGGIVALSTMSATLGALAVFVDDAATDRFRDFLVAPIRRGQLVLGYLLGALCIGMIISLVVFAVALAYLWIGSGVTLAPTRILTSIGWIALSVVSFSALWAFVVSFLRTTGAYSAVATIVGTISGFVAGAFIAVGLFPAAVRDVVSALPFAQSAMLLRQEFTADVLPGLVGGNADAIASLESFYGITLSIGAWGVPVWFAAGLLALVAVAFTVFAALRIRARIR